MAFTKIVSPGIDTTGSYTVQELNTVGVATAGTVQVGSATTIHTTGIDLGSGNITSHNINSTGSITATSFIGPVTGDITGNITGDITATSGTFSGNVSIGGTLTYEDVTNIDSVGIITAQAGIRVTGGSVGIGTDNPDSILHLNSSVPRFTLSDTGTNAHHRINADSSVGNFGFDVDYDSATSTPAFFVKIKGDEKLRITSAGLVGIGTDNPEYQTTIAAVSGNSKLNLKRLNTATDGNAFGSLFYTNSDGTDVASVRAHRESAADDSYLGFATKKTGESISEKLRITSDGLVGIGTDTTDRQLAIYHDTQATLELKSSNTGQSSLWFSDIDDGNIGGVYYTHNNDKMVLRVSDADRMTITGIGSVGISESSPDMKLELRESGVTISAAGNAISGSTMKGIHLANSNNDDTSLGIWATTGDAHWSGISFQRNDSASTWGTDLRFYTHEDDTNYLTYARERLRINANGLLINYKGQNEENTGGSILGRYKYNQLNQGNNYDHKILGPDGRKLQDFCNTNVYAVITIIVTGTGTMNMFCQYEYFAISNGQTVNLTHLRGNSGANSNRPYMLLDSYDPCWRMNHSGNYTMDIEVAIYGGKSDYTYTTEFGQFTANP